MVSTTLKNKGNILLTSSTKHHHRINTNAKQRKLKPSCAHPCRSTTHTHTYRRQRIHRRSRRSTLPTLVPKDLLPELKHHRLSTLRSQKLALISQLPKTLPRPEGAKDWECSLEGNAELETIPIEYVRDQFKVHGVSLLKIISDYSRATISTDLAPTHLLAITSQSTPLAGSKPTYTLYPTHSPLLSSYCASLPQSSFSKSSSFQEMPLPLPLIMFSIPHPSTFPLLQGFLYTHSIPGLLTSLIPLSPSRLLGFPLPSSSSSKLFSLTPKELSTTLTLPALLSSASQIHGLHANASVLRVVDNPFWNILEGAWELVRNALEEKVDASSSQLQSTDLDS